MLGRGLSLQLGRGLWGEAKVLPEQVPSPAFCPLQQMFSLQPVGVRRENPHPASTGWEQRDGSVPALAASPLLRGGGFPQDWGGGGVCAGTGVPGLGPAEAGKGLARPQALCPVPPPQVLSSRGRILHCNFKCYNFLITSSQTMSSLCGEGPPPSRLALHARRSPAPGLLWTRTAALFGAGN